MVALNKALVAAVQKHLVPQFALQTEYKPWWWPSRLAVSLPTGASTTAK